MKLDTVVLPNSLQWEDKYSSRVFQNFTRSLTGSLLYRNITKETGIPITLKSLSDAGWVRKSTVDALQELSNNVDGVYNLEIHGSDLTVIFDHTRGGLSATPLFPTGDAPSSEEYYIITLNLITI